MKQIPTELFSRFFVSLTQPPDKLRHKIDKNVNS